MGGKELRKKINFILDLDLDNIYNRESKLESRI